MPVVLLHVYKTVTASHETVACRDVATISLQVEIYLQHVLDSQRKTLGNTLNRSIGRYPNQARVEWLMNADLPGSAKKSDPAQVEGCCTSPLEFLPRVGFSWGISVYLYDLRQWHITHITAPLYGRK